MNIQQKTDTGLQENCTCYFICWLYVCCYIRNNIVGGICCSVMFSCNYFCDFIWL